MMLIKRSQLILVAGPGPGQRPDELIAYAKADPARSASVSGISSAHHLSGEMLELHAGVDMVPIRYRGGAPAAADLMAAFADDVRDGLCSAACRRGGQDARARLASSQRLALLPDMPTMAEAGLPARVLQLAGRGRACQHAASNRRSPEPGVNTILALPDRRDGSSPPPADPPAARGSSAT